MPSRRWLHDPVRVPACLALACAVALAACFPTPTPQHAVWTPGPRADVVVAPLPAVSHQPARGRDPAGFGLTWPGLLGGRFGTGTRRVRGALGAYVGLALYGDASLAVRVAQAGRLHLAVVGEGGGGVAVLAAEAILARMLGMDSLDGAFGWWRARPLVSWGPRDPAAGGPVLTVGGLYGELAGVREFGVSIGVLGLGKAAGAVELLTENPDDYKRMKVRSVGVSRSSGGGADLYVLWHGDDRRPAVLLAFSGYYTSWR